MSKPDPDALHWARQCLDLHPDDASCDWFLSWLLERLGTGSVIEFAKFAHLMLIVAQTVPDRRGGAQG